MDIDELGEPLTGGWRQAAGEPAVPLAGLMEELRAHPRLGPQVAFTAYLPAAAAAFAEPAEPLPPALSAALAGLGVERLWSHQVAGLDAVARGDNALVTTPTASGKSLVFHLPVLAEVARGGPGRALFLYPLKALGQDQKGKLDALAAAAGLDAPCAIYDGDVPPARRAKIRRRPPRVLVSNPDMLHLGILAHWHAWRGFLGELSWVVLDELHTYRGIFGSHVHHVLRRLLRICGELGARPQLVASSATAADAEAFAAALTGEPFTAVGESGAPREGRHLLLLQPQASPYTLTLQLLVTLLRRGLKTIVFTKARRITELLYRWLREQEPELARRVASYRAGFLPEERRRIEGELFAGRLQGVISTSALEMGIDVGGLDACILVGYPGSVMATWQRSGRVGRQGRESLTALVALPDALDQYFLRHPEALLERPCERLVVDPANEPVSRAHLQCAAAELPLRRDQDAAYLAPHRRVVAEMVVAHELREAADGAALYARRRRPHHEVGLRGMGESWRIVDERRRVIGLIDGVRVLHECYPRAVYLHAGRQYGVTALHPTERLVEARRIDVGYFTSALAEKETRILEVLAERRDGPLAAWLGRLEVTERVVGFERKRVFGQEVLGQEELDLPPVHFATVGLWWAAPPALEAALRQQARHVLGSLHAAEHAAISLLPLLALCDRGDLGGISLSFHDQLGCGAVFLYDGHAGGVGIAARGFAELPELLRRVAELLAGCACEEGCPSCVQSPKCGNGNRPLDKPGALYALRLLLGEEPPPAPWPEVSYPLAVGPMADSAEGAPPAVERTGGHGGPPLRPEGGAYGGSGPVVGAALRGGPRGEGVQPPPHAPPSPPAPLLGPAPAGDTVLFDLETRRSADEVGGWHNVHRMGLSVAVACFLEEDRFAVYREDQVRELVAALRGARLVVGFNLRRFDYRVLAGYTGADYNRLFPTLDLLEDVYRALGFRLPLDHLAHATLGFGKQGDGLQCLGWVREGRLDLVETYCRQDVEVLRDLYLFGRREGHVRYRDREERLLRLPVRW